MAEYQIPEKYQKRWATAMRGKSRKAAMDMFCLHCVGWEQSEVRKCTSTGCPLFRWRPATKAED